MAKTAYIKDSLTGGTTASIDGIDGSALIDGDVCFYKGDTYILNATSGATENSPYIITPDANAGDKRWELQDAGVASVDTGDNVVDSFADSPHFGCVWHYLVYNGANLQSGRILSCWTTGAGSIPSFSHASVDDLGTVTGVIAFAVNKSGNTVRLVCTATSDGWTCRVRRTLL